ncbi:hypothetical protein AYI69_g2589 [Smittium culicis]|uniref:Uncharacterized protein n=1 Tax=Smittium culicis TaxID=133412 RepID=A0A1R1YM07_9FUNG|nr:hypothetical protein AYI69_g2589 [Smittium culicis]
MIHSLEHDSLNEQQSAQTPNFKESSVDNKYATDELLDANSTKTSSNLMNDFKKENTISALEKNSDEKSSSEKTFKKINPHKHILFRANYSNILLYLSNAFQVYTPLIFF